MKELANQGEYAIEVNNVCKDFKVYYDKGYTLKEKLLFWHRNNYEVRHVLKDVSFKVKKGEAVGLIGQNGAGKSTTLKLLSKIIYPNSGEIIMRGRVACLIELGAGFHPDMSGRENIYTNAAIFGLKREEIERRIDDIIAFSELEEYIDNPVRTYSSGMYMRLAFSVAINVDADILLIDEILAVGDAAFQAKCFNRMREIKANGITIVIVSHSLGQIEQICDRTIWFKDGIIAKEGTPVEVHPFYLEYMGSKDTGSSKNDIAAKQMVKNKSKTEDTRGERESIGAEFRWGSLDIEITGVNLIGEEGILKTVFRTGESMTIEINYKNKGKAVEPIFGIGVFRNDGLQVYGVNTNIDRMGFIELNESGNVRFCIHKNNLIAGDYWLDVAIHKEDGFSYDYWKQCLTFRMYSDISDVGVTRLEHEWKIG